MPSTERHIYTISELTSSIKAVLENEFPFAWISGEISNFRRPSSGHFYFTLKDDKAQISGVMFRNQNKNLNFNLEDGQHILGLGRISVYEPRGSYQIILEFVEPKGIGALQIAFEQLKNKLDAEGLFDPKHKKSIPFLPSKISLVTSPTGSVVYDIINVSQRRFSNIPIEIVPVKVQGMEAVDQIVHAIEMLNERDGTDVIIIARGGGSLEDLQPFNSERLAHAIFFSEVPVISAIGHETDFTICDFVSDLRAPTPSAAAELAVPVKSELMNSISYLRNSLSRVIMGLVTQKRLYLRQTTKRLPHPKNRIQDLIFRIDDYSLRLSKSINRIIRYRKVRLENNLTRLVDHNPGFLIYKLKVRLEKTTEIIPNKLLNMISENKYKLKELCSTLEAINPKAILKRGYSITRSLPDHSVVRHPEDVLLNQQVEVMIATGQLICKVERISKDGEKNV